MAKEVTKAALAERVEALEKELEELREFINESCINEEAALPIQFVRELSAPKQFSTPLDFMRMNQDQVWDYSHYDEYADCWGANRYL